MIAVESNDFTFSIIGGIKLRISQTDIKCRLIQILQESLPEYQKMDNVLSCILNHAFSQWSSIPKLLVRFHPRFQLVLLCIRGNAIFLKKRIESNSLGGRKSFENLQSREHR